MKQTMIVKKLEQTLREAQARGFEIIYDPVTMIHREIAEFIGELDDSDFHTAKAYVRFGNLIVAVNDAWSNYSEYYELSN